jgi:uncharacterized protein (DUF2147 family)
MRHHACAAVIGLLTAAVLAPFGQSHAASADPTGYWMKPDAERESKIYVFKCGSGKRQLCAKIAWLKNPLDSKGGPLHDVRNENPSLRGRQIVGLPIFRGLTPSAPSTWTGKIYNPEDGRTYSATLTVLSHKRIHLRGCKAWLLCGERQWFRTAAPPPQTPAEPAKGTEQIEASVTPEAATKSASAEPSAKPGLPGQATPVALEFATPAEPPADVDARYGYRFLTISSAPDMATRFNGENVSSIFLMTKPVATAVVPAKAQPAARKPVPRPVPVTTAVAEPAPATKPAEQRAPAPQDGTAAEAGAESADGLPTEAAEAEIQSAPLTRRQRRLLRRQQRERERARESGLPWIE